MKKNDRKPWLQKPWGIPEGSVELVAAMEDVLEGDAEPYAPSRPQGNFDGTNTHDWRFSVTEAREKLTRL